MKIIWISTGDEIEFVPAHQALCEYFVSELKQRPLVCIQTDTDETVHDTLLLFLNDINQVLEHTRIADPFEIGDPYDQQYLNRLHRAWVKFHLANPNIVKLLRQKDPSLVLKFRGINKTLHKIEKMFVQTWLGADQGEAITFPNKFKELLTFSTANLQILYNDLGRNTYNKWINFDNDLNPVDTNDYENLSAELCVNLSRPMQQTAPDEYVAWCGQHGVTGTPGRWINLGNFADLETRLADYRKIIIRNRYDLMTVTF